MEQDLSLEDLTKLVTFVETHRRRGAGVLVNCAQGKSRSTAAVMAYLMASAACNMTTHASAVTSDVPDTAAGGDNVGNLKPLARSTPLGCDEALRFVQEKRRMADPNEGFILQLRAMERNGQVAILGSALAQLGS
eukprot:CAMPEP_0202849796 /NCGR_PEP_ID=MMETSP1389-20130828/81795_1 /ASSEMBLY_ACC=CAM_ASM_000865 /TAXON_ID=302021 /ORGANISM="Rhodomonas sp., Strain CCMP768" /LENGTH=134 /DNA_ID=CAMNT_0049527887 /DNA_START=19 /DNA_END=423 /DNA_ORIENTATION=-